MVKNTSLLTTVCGGLLVLTGILLVAIPGTLFPPCRIAGMMEGEGAAAICTTTGRITQALGIATIVGGALSLVAVRAAVRRGGLVLAALMALTLLPLYLAWPGICHSATMPCRAGTWPAVLVTGILQTAIVVVGLVAGSGKGVRDGGRS